MTITMIACPYCHGICPADARFCIECSAALQQAATHTTHRLFALPDPSANVPVRPARATSPFKRSRVGLVGIVIGGVPILLTVLANRNSQIYTVAALILLIGIVQFVRTTIHGQIIAGLRAAVVGMALMLSMITPWVLTICIVAGTLLVALHLVDHHRIPGHRRA